MSGKFDLGREQPTSLGAIVLLKNEPPFGPPSFIELILLIKMQVMIITIILATPLFEDGTDEQLLEEI